jgi:type II secretory ATPase GspE/PulE/Tfp pilus assembly ATPase PilB-like protein
MPTIFGEKLVIRLLSGHAQIPDMQSLGMPRDTLERFRRSVRAPHGFVVVCGPTGSGKTTTLYAALSERNVDGTNICSVEDPVELRIPGVSQVQVNPRAGVTFGSAFRAFLRQDPNVIMVGEMRDAETANVASSAALSGQLILTTLHSNDAATAVDRLLELGVSRNTLSAGLSTIVAQRLLRKLCASCRAPASVDGPTAQTFGIPAGTPAFRATGCPQCRQTGFLGRLAIFECLSVTSVIRQAIAEGASTTSLAAALHESSYEPLSADGIRKALSGETTFEELLRVTMPEPRA